MTKALVFQGIWRPASHSGNWLPTEYRSTGYASRVKIGDLWIVETQKAGNPTEVTYDEYICTEITGDPDNRTTATRYTWELAGNITNLDFSDTFYTKVQTENLVDDAIRELSGTASGLVKGTSAVLNADIQTRALSTNVTAISANLYDKTQNLDDKLSAAFRYIGRYETLSNLYSLRSTAKIGDVALVQTIANSNRYDAWMYTGDNEFKDPYDDSTGSNVIAGWKLLGTMPKAWIDHVYMRIDYGEILIDRAKTGAISDANNHTNHVSGILTGMIDGTSAVLQNQIDNINVELENELTYKGYVDDPTTLVNLNTPEKLIGNVMVVKNTQETEDQFDARSILSSYDTYVWTGEGSTNNERGWHLVGPIEGSKLSAFFATKDYANDKDAEILQAAHQYADDHISSAIADNLRTVFKIKAISNNITSRSELEAAVPASQRKAGDVYLIKSSSVSELSLYDEYVVKENGGDFELLGSIDAAHFENYYTKSEVNADFLKKTDAAATYITNVSANTRMNELEGNLQTLNRSLNSAKTELSGVLSSYTDQREIAIRSTMSEKEDAIYTTIANKKSAAVNEANTYTNSKYNDMKAYVDNTVENSIDTASNYIEEDIYNNYIGGLLDKDNLLDIDINDLRSQILSTRQYADSIVSGHNNSLSTTVRDKFESLSTTIDNNFGTKDWINGSLKYDLEQYIQTKVNERTSTVLTFKGTFEDVSELDYVLQAQRKIGDIYLVKVKESGVVVRIDEYIVKSATGNHEDFELVGALDNTAMFDNYYTMEQIEAKLQTRDTNIANTNANLASVNSNLTQNYVTKTDLAGELNQLTTTDIPARIQSIVASQRTAKKVLRYDEPLSKVSNTKCIKLSDIVDCGMLVFNTALCNDVVDGSTSAYASLANLRSVMDNPSKPTNKASQSAYFFLPWILDDISAADDDTVRSISMPVKVRLPRYYYLYGTYNSGNGDTKSAILTGYTAILSSLYLSQDQPYIFEKGVTTQYYFHSTTISGVSSTATDNDYCLLYRSTVPDGTQDEDNVYIDPTIPNADYPSYYTSITGKSTYGLICSLFLTTSSAISATHPTYCNANPNTDVANSYWLYNQSKTGFLRDVNLLESYVYLTYEMTVLFGGAGKQFTQFTYNNGHRYYLPRQVIFKYNSGNVLSMMKDNGSDDILMKSIGYESYDSTTGTGNVLSGLVRDA